MLSVGVSSVNKPLTVEVNGRTSPAFTAGVSIGEFRLKLTIILPDKKGVIMPTFQESNPKLWLVILVEASIKSITLSSKAKVTVASSN
jgi:hypothetical protein